MNNHLSAELTIVQTGKCPVAQPSFSFSPIYSPVCGSDNLTYGNVEALILRNELAAAGQYLLTHTLDSLTNTYIVNASIMLRVGKFSTVNVLKQREVVCLYSSKLNFTKKMGVNGILSQRLNIVNDSK